MKRSRRKSQTRRVGRPSQLSSRSSKKEPNSPSRQTESEAENQNCDRSEEVNEEVNVKRPRGLIANSTDIFSPAIWIELAAFTELCTMGASVKVDEDEQIVHWSMPRLDSHISVPISFHVKKELP